MSYQPSAPEVPKKYRTVLRMIRANGLLTFVTEKVETFLTPSVRGAGLMQLKP
ncbi:hypothetical protein JCM19039_952 [Geomicrobium sp. JCM 19039]|nr:hypothetical protein JCM19039_952 [Geomicrobium sp. JCM 19039]